MIEITEIKYDMEVEFIARPNRYLAEVSIEGKTELAHVHDPGRLKELLYPGNKVLIRKAENQNRKTAAANSCKSKNKQRIHPKNDKKRSPFAITLQINYIY